MHGNYRLRRGLLSHLLTVSLCAIALSGAAQTTPCNPYFYGFSVINNYGTAISFNLYIGTRGGTVNSSPPTGMAWASGSVSLPAHSQRWWSSGGGGVSSPWSIEPFGYAGPGTGAHCAGDGFNMTGYSIVVEGQVNSGFAPMAGPDSNTNRWAFVQSMTAGGYSGAGAITSAYAYQGDLSGTSDFATFVFDGAPPVPPSTTTNYCGTFNTVNNSATPQTFFVQKNGVDATNYPGQVVGPGVNYSISVTDTNGPSGYAVYGQTSQIFTYGEGQYLTNTQNSTPVPITLSNCGVTTNTASVNQGGAFSPGGTGLGAGGINFPTPYTGEATNAPALDSSVQVGASAILSGLQTLDKDMNAGFANLAQHSGASSSTVTLGTNGVTVVVTNVNNIHLGPTNTLLASDGTAFYAPVVTAATTAGTAAGAAIASASTSLASPPATGDTPAPSIFSIYLPSMGTINFDPLSNTYISICFGLVKAFLTWVILFWQYRETVKILDVNIRAAATAPQAGGTSQAVFGVNAESVTAFAAATAITVIVAIVPSFITAFWSSHGYVSAVIQNPFSALSAVGAIGQAALHLLGAAFPLDLIYVGAVSLLSFRLWCVNLFLIVSTVVRFIIR